MWKTSDWAGWALLQVGALVACLCAWVVAADRIVYSDQVGLATISVVGLAVSALAHAWILQRGRRQIGTRRSKVLGIRSAALAAARVAGTPAVGPTPEAAQVVVAGEGRYYHRPSCVMAAGRDWPLSTAVVQQGADRTACRVCAP